MMLHCLTLEKMETLARKLADSLSPGISLCFIGGLGAGKSTLARFILQVLNPLLKEVPSPTYTLIQEYETSKGAVWHCDFYRLKSPHEVINLGMEDAFYSGICLIEWPEKIQDYLPENRIDVQISINPDNTRTVTIIGHGEIRGYINDFSL